MVLDSKQGAVVQEWRGKEKTQVNKQHYKQKITKKG